MNARLTMWFRSRARPPLLLLLALLASSSIPGASAATETIRGGGTASSVTKEESERIHESGATTRRNLQHEPSYSFTGCYKDNGSDRALPYYRGQVNTTAECSLLCASIGATYMGRQWWYECWCGGPGLGGAGYDAYGSGWCTNCESSEERQYYGENCVFDLGTGGFTGLPAPIDSYEGCYADSGSSRDLEEYVGQKSLADCASECDSKNYLYMGRQWQQECWCGNSTGSHGPAFSCNDCTNSTAGYNIGGSVNCVFSLGGSVSAPTDEPSDPPSALPSASPSDPPSASPSAPPSGVPSGSPTAAPTASPIEPTDPPSASPSEIPSASPTAPPSESSSPTQYPSSEPSGSPAAGVACGGTTASPFQCPVIEFKGCYKDDAVRDLPIYVGGMDTQTCAETCANKGYAYMGRQYLSECWCGQSYGLHGTSNSCNQCDITNPGSGHSYGGSVNCVFQLKVEKATCVESTVKALLVKPDTFVWWHGGWQGNVEGYMRWLQDRIVALHNLGVVEGVSVAVRMNDERSGVPFSDFFYTSGVSHTKLYTLENYQEQLLYDFLKAMRQNGIKTYAWVPAFYDPVLIQSGGASTYAAVERSGAGGSLQASDRFASVFSSAARQHILDIIEEVLTKTELNEIAPWDGVRLDYIRFESYKHDFSDEALAQFEALGKPDPYHLDQDLTDSDWVDWMTFRREAVTDFLRNATDHARSFGGTGLDVGGYLLPFAAPGCMENHNSLGYETLGWEQGNCYQDYDAFNFRLLPMTYWQDWSPTGSESDFNNWTSEVVESTAAYGNARTTPTGSITECGFGGCSNLRSASQIVASFRAFAQTAAQQSTDGIDVFLFDEFEDSHLNNLEEALVC